MSKPKHIGIIGGGIAGLAVAIRLAVKGHDVELFEANSYLGGKIAEQQLGDYRFDMGPSVLTMPRYIDELFELAGENPRDHFNYERLDPVFQYFFEDGTVLHTYADTEELIREFTSKTTVRAEDLRTFFRRSKEKLELTDEVFLQRSLHQWKNYLDWPTLRGILNFQKVEAFTTMAKANAKLLKDEKVAAIFNQYASYNGSDPFTAPATLNLISHYEITLGAYYPKGGMRSIINALIGLAERVGVKVHVNTKVERLTVDNGRCSGLLANGEEKRFDSVVANSDIFKTYHNLMPEQKRPERILNQPKSSSVIVFYWGMRKKFPQLKLHNMFMGADQRAEYAQIFGEKTVAAEPTVYLYISCKQNLSDAPENGENWFAMVTVPHNSGQDWDKLVSQTRSRVLERLSRQLNEDLEPLIEEEAVLDPRIIEERTGSAFGSVYGNSSNGKFAAFLRHPNFSSKIDNLYFCGGSVHPGSSIPLCLLSAKITAGMI
ncbi:MAG: phytoene desaturase [Flavobacteriales bacterium]|nr:phytoene desaturase [Flavobacteriales bacterium]